MDHNSLNNQTVESLDSSINTTNASNTGKSSSSRSSHYCDHYFEIKDILALSERVLCTFLVSMPKLGFLDPSSDSEHIEKGTKLELPLWMAKDLTAEGFVQINVPKGFNETYREILEADATCVNLHKLGPNYYRFGQHLAHMSIDESEEIANSLVETFHQRYHRLANYSLSGRNDTINEIMSFYSQLDNDEKRIFSCGRDSVNHMISWENRSIETVTANDMVINLRKRKLLLMEDNDSHTSSQNTS